MNRDLKKATEALSRGLNEEDHKKKGREHLERAVKNGATKSSKRDAQAVSRNIR